MAKFPDYLENKTIFDEKDFFDGNRFNFYIKNITVAISTIAPMFLQARSTSHLI